MSSPETTIRERLEAIQVNSEGSFEAPHWRYSSLTQLSDGSLVFGGALEEGDVYVGLKIDVHGRVVKEVWPDSGEVAGITEPRSLLLKLLDSLQ